MAYRIVIGSITLLIGILAYLRIWWGGNGLLPTISNSTVAQSLKVEFDPNLQIAVGVTLAIIFIGLGILVSGIRSSLSNR